MKTDAVLASWIVGEDHRLDPRPYTNGTMQMRNSVLKLPHSRLSELTKGFKGGIFTHLFSPKRTYVTDARHGVPFLGASSMRLADLNGLPLLSLKDANSRSYSPLKIRTGMTLISCSGSVGRMTYARADMDGMASAGDLLKVQPNKEVILSGYLYAYLSCRVGAMLVGAGTYGTIVQHLETQHVVDIPVPRLGDHIEQRAHDLVEEAARLRVKASLLVRDAVLALEAAAGLPCLVSPSSATPYSCTTVSALGIQSRFDAFFHSPYRANAIAALEDGALPAVTVAGLSRAVVEPNRFKRVKVEDQKFGLKLFGTSALMWNEPTEMYSVPKNQVGIKQYIVDRRTLLIPRSGQLPGIIGKVVMPHGDVLGGAVSEDAIRIHCDNENSAGFLFVALSSPYSVRQLKASAYGSSIPHLDVHQIARVLVTDPGDKERARLGSMGARARALRDDAVRHERTARALVERAIEEAG